MFRKSKPQSDPGLFTGIGQHLNGIRLNALNEQGAWHNVFRDQIVSGIDESVFSVLYNKSNGRPNASIRILIGMMILKEGHVWSDAKLFENCQFNLLVMNALGLSNINDEIPASSTYYSFRKELVNYQLKEGKDLVGECFEKLTKGQVEMFGLSGKQLRMDSKLVGSNIVKSSRLGLILSCLGAFYGELSDELRKRVSEQDREYLDSLFRQKASQIIYNLDSDAKSGLLAELGEILCRFTEIFADHQSDEYRIIVRVFEEQYSKTDEKIELRPNGEIKADSLQSPYDEDAEYRNKGGTKVQGYSVNLTETCLSAETETEGEKAGQDSVRKLSLITHVQVEGATYADNNFLKNGIEQSEKIVGKAEAVFSDGAYHSQENEKYGQQKEIVLYFTGFPGKKGRFEFNKSARGLEVIDTQTGQTYIAAKVEPRKKGKKGPDRYKFEYMGEDGKRVVRYFDQQSVDAFFRRQEIEQLPAHLKNTRCNVEASIFQLAFGLRKDKTRYRGKFKTQLWASNRCFWINFKRIVTYLGEVCPDHPKNGVCVQNLVIFVQSVLLGGIPGRPKVKNRRNLLYSIFGYSDIRIAWGF